MHGYRASIVIASAALIVAAAAVVIAYPRSVNGTPPPVATDQPQVAKEIPADVPTGPAALLRPSGSDDTARIQAALNESRLVELSPGRFRVTSTITMDGDRALLGSGQGITTVSSTARAQTIQVNSGAKVTTHTVRVESLTLEGNGTGQVGIRWGQTEVSPRTGTGSMRNVTVRGFTDAGVQLVVTVGLRLDGLILEHNKYGLHLAVQQDNGNTTVHVEGCWCRENTIGLFMEQGRSVWVRDSIFEANTQEGVLVRRPDRPEVRMGNVTFADNMFERNNMGRPGTTNYQFRAEAAASSTFRGLALERNTFTDARRGGHVFFGRGLFRDIDNEYVAPTAGAVTCENTSECVVFSKNDRAPSEFWTLPSGTPQVTWQHGVTMWTNVGGVPTKR